MFKTIKGNVSAEIVEKKSKFIANLFYVESAVEAENIIKRVKKQYYDARHNCFAYSIYTSDGIQNRFSDDGEPSGTAGSPMLNMITSQNLSNVLVVVTRYFGGVLLGTGGLVRAYTGALEEALNKAEKITKDLGIEVEMKLEYPDLEKAKYYLTQNNINIVDIIYGENITLIFETINEKLEEIEKNRESLNFKIKNLEVVEEKYIMI